MGSATPIRTGGIMAEPHAGREEARRLRPTRGVAHDRRVPSDVEAITPLIMAYAERLDAGDLDGVAALFADVLYDGIPCTRHVVTNLTTAQDSPWTARPARAER